MLFAPITTALAQGQTAIAQGACSVAVNASGRAHVVVSVGCDPTTAQTINSLIEQQGLQDERMNLSERALSDQQDALNSIARTVNAIRRSARVKRNRAQQAIDKALVAGDTVLATQLLAAESRELERKGAAATERAAALQIQRGTLLRTFDPEAALQAFETAASLSDEDPEALQGAASLARDIGYSSKAAAYFLRAVAIAEKGVALRSDATSLATLANTLTSLGDALVKLGRAPDAVSRYDRALLIARNAIKTFPDHLGCQRSLWLSLYRLGGTETYVGNVTAAGDHIREALALALKMSSIHVDDQLWTDAIARSLSALASTESEQRAESTYEAALSIRRKLAKSDPDNEIYASTLVGVLVAVGRSIQWTSTDADKYAKRIALYDEARSIVQRMASAHPKIERWQEHMYDLSYYLSVAYSEAGKYELAVVAARQALDATLSLAMLDAGNLERLVDVSLAHDRLADVYADQGVYELALTSFESALEAVERTTTVPERNQQWVWRSNIHEGISAALRGLGKTEEAARHDSLAIAILESAFSQNPQLVGPPLWRRYVKRGHAFALDGKQLDAEAAFVRALTIATDLEKTAPDDRSPSKSIASIRQFIDAAKAAATGR